MYAKMMPSHTGANERRTIMMQRNAGKLLSILLITVMLFLLGGCGSSEKDALIGTWTTELNLADAIKTAIAENSDEEMIQYIQLDEFKIGVSLTFREDDTYTMAADPESIQASLKKFTEMIRTGVEEYFRDILAAEGIDMEELGMTLEDVLALSGVSLDDLLAEAFDGEMIDEIVGSMDQEGNFKAKNGKLYMSAGKSFGIDESQYVRYTLEGTSLTFVEYVSSGVLDDLVVTLYPAHFEKTE